MTDDIVSPIISVSSLSVNDMDMLNKEIAKYPDYEPFSVYSYLNRTYVLLRKSESQAKYEVALVDLQFTNNVLEFNQWLLENEGWVPLAVSTNQGKSWAYVYKRS